jgi:2-dehydropantoate 2-reductase
MEIYRTLFADRTSGYTTSMLRDVEAGKQTEAQHVIVQMVREARLAELEGSLFEVALANLEVYEQRRQSGRV